tara:strand:+ start:55 stop:462 length:408 start_codon:yes stop_codon:yes gene_type:complete
MNKVEVKLGVHEVGKKIPLIKFWRWFANSGLKEAKDYIEELIEQTPTHELASIITDTNLSREQIEKMAKECNIEAKVTSFEGAYGSFETIEDGIVHIQMTVNGSSFDANVKKEELGVFLDVFINSIETPNEFKGE